jgi:hypothetical protein
MVARPRELAGTRLGGGGHGGRRRAQVAAGGSAREARGGSTFRRRARALPKDGGSAAVVQREERDTAGTIGPTQCVRPVPARRLSRHAARGGRTSRRLGTRGPGEGARGLERRVARMPRAVRRTRGCDGALERGWRRGHGRVRLNVSDWQRLTGFFSKFLNRSAQSGK